MKPQSAFFEALGADGFRALEEVCDYSRSAGLLVVLDAKRCDIGSTSRAYSAAFLEPRDGDPPLADVLTASPYLGLDSVEPFLAACRRHGSGVFFLVRTSNAGAADVQDLALSDGRPSGTTSPSSFVSGASHSSAKGAVERRRRRRGDASAGRLGSASPAPAVADPPPGCGRATPADVARAFTAGPASALVTASRSVIYAYRDTEADWRAAAAAEAERLATQVWAAAGW